MSAKSLNRLLILAIATALAFMPAAWADFRLERELKLAPGGAFILDSDTGSIEIRGVDRTGARIVITSPRDDIEERFSFAFDERGDDAVVKVEKRGSLARRWFSGGDERLRFEVEVPRRVDLDLSTAGGAIDAASIQGRVDLHSSGGSIDITDVEGDVDAHTSGGSMSARSLSGNVRLDTSGGSIRAEEIGGDLVAETGGGSIEALDVGGVIEAHTSGGPVRASFTAGNGSGGTLTSSGGGITATVDPTVALEIDAHTSGGKVTLDVPVAVRGTVSRNTMRGELNGGGPLLKLRSSGGSIRLRSR
jgi:DUF4097 and DUF4098 domain-containing protein YvlB